MPNFDSYQQSAIDALGRNIVVSASAGAGKTAVLVQRLVKRCVDDQIPINEILAVTFTSAAAGEMKKRLSQMLNEKLSTETDETTKAYLSQQLIDLETAQITTIDSYCLNIIQKYYNVIGLDPATSRNILAEGVNEDYRRQAYFEALKDLSLQDRATALRLLKQFSKRSEDYDSLYDILKNINQHANSSIDPDTWYKNAAESYAPVKTMRDFPENIQTYFYHKIELHLLGARENLQLMLEHVEECKKPQPEYIEAKLNSIDACLEALKTKDYIHIMNRIDAMNELQTKPSGIKGDAYSMYRKAVGDQIQKIMDIRFPQEVFLRDSNDLDALCHSLVDLAKDMNDRYQAIKQKHTCMDFSDMERYAYRILMQNNGEVASIIRDSVQEIMVDEFQDTSELQDEIIRRISRGNNIFRVGDVKQSIYRFRQAKPSLMRNLMAAPEEEVENITLVHNYRSRDSIVQFTNALFKNAMNVPGCEDHYSAIDEVSVGTDRQKEAPVAVTFAEIEAPLDENGEEDDEAPDTKQLKARYIANQIVREMKNDSHLRFKDFAVLVRGHTDKVYLRSAFDEAGIPYDIDAKEGFYQSQLCQTILSFLRYMTDASDAIALLSVLTSSFYSLSDEELAQLSIQYGSVQTGIEQKYPEILSEIEELKQIAGHDGVQTMLNEIAKRHDYFPRLSKREQANFDFLYETVIAQNILTLTDLYTIMSISEDEKSVEASSNGKDDDVVTVTTIHHSKGLQYAYVFLWSTSQNRNMDNNNPVLVDDELYIGLKHVDFPYRGTRPTVQRIACAYKSDVEDLEEMTRILYVAITRAERRLFIVDKAMDIYDRPVTLPLLNARKGMSGLILAAMPEGSYFQRILVTETEIEEQAAHTDLIHYAKQLPVWNGPIPKIVEMTTPSQSELTFLPPLDIEQKNGTSYGTRMHEILSELPTHRIWTKEDLKPYDLPLGDQERILAFTESELFQKTLHCDVHHEYPFYINTEDVHMNGIMDYVAFSEDIIYLIDYKTDNCSIEEIKSRYSEQLNQYRKALSYIQPNTPIEVYAWSLHHKQAIVIE